MSDFIFSRKSIPNGVLTNAISEIYDQGDLPTIQEFHGKFGSLGVSANVYTGFDPYETDEHVLVVIGGPVLCFRDNEFLSLEKGGNEGSRSIYFRWLSGEIKWESDLSGPFAILLVNKIDGNIKCVTDLMSFIPVYNTPEGDDFSLSTHVDILASINPVYQDLDPISHADFILHGVITYPYTGYKKIRQLAPCTNFELDESNKVVEKAYWQPLEINKYRSINAAASQLRSGLQSYVDSITKSTREVAQFISGGEDSRAISGLISKKINRNAFIFLNEFNREGRIAKKVAGRYGANLVYTEREFFHYLRIMPEASRLVGSGSQYTHLHTLGFHKICDLRRYSAVFGGLLADALIKGSHIRKKGKSHLPFYPDKIDLEYSANNLIKNTLFSVETLEEVTLRRTSHLNLIKQLRPVSYEEWFELWPFSMNQNAPNIHGNRRLFKSYEPFTANEVVKVSASVPQNWKLDRKLFHKAVKCYLKPSRFIPHIDGRLPYYSWRANLFLSFSVRAYWKVKKKFVPPQFNGSWANWRAIESSKEWEDHTERYLKGLDYLKNILNDKRNHAIFKDDQLDMIQKLNLVQTLYFLTEFFKTKS